MNESNNRVDLETQDATTVDVLIVGYGLSSIPLVRELEASRVNYLVISKSVSIWDTLAQHNRLDFDLVSSLHSSIFSFELVNQGTSDRYTTASEFAGLISKYKKLYGSKVVDDEVVRIDNYPEYSDVYTSNARYRCRQLVVSTAFRRRIHEDLKKYDFESARGKTLVVPTSGDSGNLIISKLVPQKNRVIVLTNGFVALDKFAYYNNKTYTIDQLEYHTVRDISKYLYTSTISGGISIVLNFPWMGKGLFGKNFYVRHPLARRTVELTPALRPTLTKPPVRNGIIAIKYWPIDTYKRRFGADLEGAISEGFLLNDLPYFVEQGLVELWPKDETSIDRKNKVIRWNDKVVHYDDMFEADRETPNLPPINVHSAGGPSHAYEYVCRNTFMGVVPRELSKVYLLGITRPTTGGLNNISEMQCLFIHKMVTDSTFHERITANLGSRIEEYNKNYYATPVRKGTDHLVYYGFYTQDIARLLGIDVRLSDCRSIRDVIDLYFFPNNAFKYRQRGAYAVPGVKEMTSKIAQEHKHFSLLLDYVVTFLLINTHLLTILWFGFGRQMTTVTDYVVFLATAVTIIFQPFTQLIAANTVGVGRYINLVLSVSLVAAIYQQSTMPSVVGVVLAFCLIYISRLFGWSRVFFNDMRHRQGQVYRDFFDRYCAAFNRRSDSKEPTSTEAPKDRSGELSPVG